MRLPSPDDEQLELVDPMCTANPERCRWGCGNQCSHPVPNRTESESFREVASRFLSRRSFLVGGAAAAGMLVVSRTPFGEGILSPTTANAAGPTGIGFAPIKLSGADKVEVAAGYTSKVLIRWGDPMTVDTAPFDPKTMTAADQMTMFGYNCDYLGYIPLSDKSGILVANNEYTNPELMFPGYSADAPTKEQVDIELAAHGVSIVNVERHRTLGWRYVMTGWANRRVHGFTKTMFTGPVAGNAMVKTKDDPTGYFPIGTLNNCSAGVSPWGTILTCEENFNQYFANNDNVADAKVKSVHARYGLTAKASERKWERFHDRFDLGKEPNEAFRFGWVVEIDPMDPGSMPRKHTALGRFKHEATSTALDKAGHAVVYMGDDERFDYMYKFISKGTYKADDREANMNLLSDGTLYVAKFNDNGKGEWIPLVYGENGLTAANGFASQADVCLKTRLAGDQVKATKMDRPEDIEINPTNGKVYAVMTNNTRRGTTGQPAVDAANPRADNKHGHIIEITPDGGDHAAKTFGWGFLIICGDPAVDKGTYWSGIDPTLISPISSPDNITFDKAGNLWISTDGQTGTFLKNDGVFAVPTEGPERGWVRQFMSGVPGGECASLVLDDTNKAMFVSIQHPAEGSTLAKPSSTFPDGGQPRPSVVFITKDDGGIIGS